MLTLPGSDLVQQAATSTKNTLTDPKKILPAVIIASVAFVGYGMYTHLRPAKKRRYAR